MRIFFIFSIVVLVCSTGFLLAKKKAPFRVEDAKRQLGRELFFDKTLSNPDGQSCTVCHAPKTSFSDPNHAVVSEGMIDGAFTNRNSQSLAYVGFIPDLAYSEKDGEWRGGLFWDGRSGNLEHQLSGPFFNIAEMNNIDTTMLVSELRKASYYKLYRKIYGRAKDETTVYNNICQSLALFERSETFNEFSSKFDLVLKGKAEWTEEEKLGLDLFTGKANCVACHSMEPLEPSGKILFTNYSYHNLGVPRNTENPFYTTSEKINPEGENATDLGLGITVKDPEQDGKFRTPTLRNVQYTGPYFHNGYFKTIKETVHFINTRNEGHYPSPEVVKNVARQRTGSLNLSDKEENAIVAFLLALTDGYERE